MPLSAGTRLGPYDVLSPLGVGGMGEVYRARDGKLNRDVAIKILPPELAGDAERKQRFEQEARAASSLNHPSIVHVYDVDSTDLVHYIAMELVEGRSLRTKPGKSRSASDGQTYAYNARRFLSELYVAEGLK